MFSQVSVILFMGWGGYLRGVYFQGVGMSSEGIGMYSEGLGMSTPMYWHLVAGTKTRTVGKRAGRILICFLDIDVIFRTFQVLH